MLLNVAVVDFDDEDFAIEYRYSYNEKEEMKMKKRYIHVASIIAAAIPASTIAIMAAEHTKKQSRRTERFLNYIKIKS